MSDTFSAKDWVATHTIFACTRFQIWEIEDRPKSASILRDEYNQQERRFLSGGMRDMKNTV